MGVLFNTESINTGADGMSILKVSIEQVKAARALLRWSQADLADTSGISLPTIKRLEAATGEIGGREDTATAIRASLEAAGVEFIPENGGGPGVRLRKMLSLAETGWAPPITKGQARARKVKPQSDPD